MSDVRLSSSIEIGAPPEQVFDRLIDVERMNEWQTDLVRAKRLDGGALASGSRFEQVRQFGGREQKTTAVVDDLEAPERFTWRSDDGPVKATGGYRLDPSGVGTALQMDFTLRGRGFLGLILKLTHLKSQRTAQTSLETFKQVVENEGSTPG